MLLWAIGFYVAMLLLVSSCQFN